MMREVQASEAKTHLPQLLDEVEHGETIVITRHGKLGTVVDQVLLYCFHYDPLVGRYSAVTLNIMRLSAVVTVVALALFVVFLRRRETAEPGPLGAA